MRHVLTFALLAGVVSCQAPHESTANPAVTAEALILARDEGERRLRRPRPDGAGSLAAPSLIIKVDREHGGSPNFFMGYEEVQPGASIPMHRHRGYDEILIIHRGQGRATLGDREADVTEGATIYIPPNTRVGLRNTGNEPLQLMFIFPHPERVSAYYDELTVTEGEPLTPFSRDEFTAFRARHQGHIEFE
jgi:quercetin dioxygenase-like cupin family protein